MSTSRTKKKRHNFCTVLLNQTRSSFTIQISEKVWPSLGLRTITMKGHELNQIYNNKKGNNHTCSYFLEPLGLSHTSTKHVEHKRVKTFARCNLLNLFHNRYHQQIKWWMNEWMCIYIPHISHTVSRRFTILIEWDRTSACKGASGCRYQSIFDLTHPPSPCMKCTMKQQIDHHTGNYAPYSFRQVCGFFNVPCWPCNTEDAGDGAYGL